MALGQAYRDGNGAPQNDVLAVKWFQKAADQADAAAENALGLMYRSGQGVAQNKEEAVRWYLKAAKQGNSKAMFNLGVSYYNGDGVAIDDMTSYAWFSLAYESGNPAAKEALERATAEKSLVPSEAFVKLGQMYEKGDVLPKNSAEVLRWYRKAADAGSPQAAVKVSSLLLASGRVLTPEQYAEIRERCEAAAKRDYSPGAYCLALMYRGGIGISKDDAEGMKWLSRAAELGHSKAALKLGEAYWRGEGVKPNLVAAYMWIWLALNAKEPGAEQDEQGLRKELPAKKVDEAKRKAIEWARGHRPLELRVHGSSDSSN